MINPQRAFTDGWPEGEKVLTDNPFREFSDQGVFTLFTFYKATGMKGRWPELERRLVKTNILGLIVWYTHAIGERLPELENRLLEALREAISSYSLTHDLRGLSDIAKYVENFMGGEWPEVDEIILNESTWKDILNWKQWTRGSRPWPELEKRLLKDPFPGGRGYYTDQAGQILYYAHAYRDPNRDPWVEGENWLRKNAPDTYRGYLSLKQGKGSAKEGGA